MDERSEDAVQKSLSDKVLADHIRDSMISAIEDSEDFDFDTMPLSDWITKYTKLGYEPFSFEEHPYQIAIINDPCKHLVIMKSCQMGVSEIMMRLCIALMIRYNRTKVLYALPTDNLMHTLSDTRIKPIFEDSPKISKFIKNEPGKKKTQNAERKQIRNSFMMMISGWDAKTIQSMDIDFLFVDEFDKQNDAAIGAMRARMDHSKFRYEYDFSTPSLEDVTIHAAYKETDQKEWFLICPKCGKEQFLTYEHIMWYPEDVDRTDAYFGCLDCKCKLNRFKGQWKPTAKGQRGVSGYHITQAMSPRKSAQEIYETRLNPHLYGYKSDMDYWNYVWGLPYKSDLSNEMDQVNYDDLVGDYHAITSDDIESSVDFLGETRNIMAIDWGKPWSWAEVRQVNLREGTCKILWLEAFKSERADDHPARMIDLARKFRCVMVVGDIGYSDSRGDKLHDILGDMFWDVASMATGVIEPVFDKKKHRIRCFKETILKRHYVLLVRNKISLPIDDETIKVSKEPKTRVQIWIEHHKNIHMRKDREGKEEMIFDGPDHFALTSAYADLAFEYLLKRQELTRMSTQNRSVKVRIIR